MSRDGALPLRTKHAWVLTGLSCRLWNKLTDAILASDMDAATEAKTAVEDAQRETRRKREENGEQHIARYFDLQDGRWIPKIRWVLHEATSDQV